MTRIPPHCLLIFIKTAFFTLKTLLNDHPIITLRPSFLSLTPPILTKHSSILARQWMKLIWRLKQSSKWGKNSRCFVSKHALDLFSQSDLNDSGTLCSLFVCFEKRAQNWLNWWYKSTSNKRHNLLNTQNNRLVDLSCLLSKDNPFPIF